MNGADFAVRLSSRYSVQVFASLLVYLDKKYPGGSKFVFESLGDSAVSVDFSSSSTAAKDMDFNELLVLLDKFDRLFFLQRVIDLLKSSASDASLINSLVEEAEELALALYPGIQTDG